MLKKFLIGTFALALVLVIAQSASAFSGATLRVGSTGPDVMELQALVGAGVDGSFGPMTKAAVMAWQANNGLTPDGIFGPASMAKAASLASTVVTPSVCQPGWTTNPMTGLPCGTTTTLPAGCMPGYLFSPTSGVSCTGGTNPVVVSGGAGDLTITTSSKNTESVVKEGDEEKVLGFKVEADDSDIQITNAKIILKNTSSATGSEKLEDYVEEVKVYLGSKEVGSVDADDFSRESGSPDIFTELLSLDGAIVKDGDTDYLYVAIVANSDMDDSDVVSGLAWYVALESIRYVDGTGAIMTDGSSSSVLGYENNIDFKLASEDDQLDIKSSSSNPDDMTVKVDENDTTDDVLALAFKLDNDEDSSDMDIQTIVVTADTSLSLSLDAAGVTAAEKFIDSVTLKLAGKDFTAEDLVVADIAANGVITYTFDIDGDVTIDAGDVEEAEVEVTFYKQGSTGANYANNTTVKFSVTSSGITAEIDGDSVSSGDISGTQNGPVLTVNSAAATVSNYSWTVSSVGTIIDFFFKVEADDEDFTVLASSLEDATAGNAVFANSSVPTLSKFSGTATTATEGVSYVVSEGDNATFRLRYTLTATAGDNGKWAEVSVTSIAGQTVPDDKETSPTATVNL